MFEMSESEAINNFAKYFKCEFDCIKTEKNHNSYY